MGLEGGIGIGIANQHRGNGGQTRSLHGLQVNLNHQLALLDLVAVVHMHSEGLALQAHGLQADVDENLNAGFGNQADGVAGVEHHINGGIAGGIHLTLGGLDGNAIAQHSFCKGGVGNLGNCHGLTGHRCTNPLQLLTEQFIHETHSILVPFKLMCRFPWEKRCPFIYLRIYIEYALFHK